MVINKSYPLCTLKGAKGDLTAIRKVKKVAVAVPNCMLKVQKRGSQKGVTERIKKLKYSLACNVKITRKVVRLI